MNCWNCENALDSPLLCGRCGVPQPVEFLGSFEALGLPPRLTLNADELDQGYERLARACHPDLFRAHMDERVLTASRVAMRTLNDAHRTLSGPIDRLRYVLATCGRSTESTRTVPEALQTSAQIIGRVLATVEKARAQGDQEAWEAEQDHLASIQVQVEKADQRSNSTMMTLFMEWDDAVGSAGNDWPEMSEGWYEQALRWMGEREYLESLIRRVAQGRQAPSGAPVGDK